MILEADLRCTSNSGGAMPPLALVKATKCHPDLENDVEAASEVASVGSKELTKLRIRNVASHITRIEVICQVKSTNRQPDTIFFCHLKLLGNFYIKRKECRKAHPS